MAVPKECKRLAEVDFPIAEVSQYRAPSNPYSVTSRAGE